MTGCGHQRARRAVLSAQS